MVRTFSFSPSSFFGLPTCLFSLLASVLAREILEECLNFSFVVRVSKMFEMRFFKELGVDDLSEFSDEVFDFFEDNKDEFFIFADSCVTAFSF